MVIDYLKIALLMIRAKPVRAALSFLGIYIGVLALIVILCLQEGLRRDIETLYKTQDAQVALVYPGFDPTLQAAGLLTKDDVTHLQSDPTIQSVLPRYQEDQLVRNPAAQMQAHVFGVDVMFLKIFRIPLLRGRFFIPTEIEHRQPVCLLSQSAAQKLFAFSDAVGQHVDMAGSSFEIVGVVDWNDATTMRTMLDQIQVLVPETWLPFNQTSPFITTLEVRLDPSLSPNHAEDLVRTVLSRGDADRAKRYNVFSLEEFFRRRQGRREETLRSLLAIAAVSLLVGTIGVANVMLTSVTERTREVGIRKALGARRRDILFQFLVEASVLSASGGLLAVFTGWLITVLYPMLVKTATPLAFPVPQVAGCFVLTFVIGLVAGLYPASHAAGLPPAEALRYE